MERKGDIFSDTGMSQTFAGGEQEPTVNTNENLRLCLQNSQCTVLLLTIICFMRPYLKKNLVGNVDFSCENIFSNLILI